MSTQGRHDAQVLLPLAWAKGIKTIATYNARGERETSDQLEKTGYSAVAVQAKTNADVANITAAVAKKGYGFTSTQQQIERINGLTTIMWALFGSIALISLITACLGIANTMLTTISEQRHTIGVWRAAGARRSVIARQYVTQAAILGAVGGSIGVAAGWIASRSISSYVASLLQQQGLPALDIVQASPLLLAVSLLAAVVLGAIAGIYPAWRASRQDPSAALSAGQ